MDRRQGIKAVARKTAYLLTIYTRYGHGTDFKPLHCRSEVTVNDARKPTRKMLYERCDEMIDLAMATLS